MTHKRRLLRLTLVLVIAWVTGATVACRKDLSDGNSIDPPAGIEDAGDDRAKASIPSNPSPAPKIRVLAWNVESGGANPNVIAERIKEYSIYQIIGLSEVHPDDFKIYQEALGQRFGSVTSESGNEDRLQIFYDQTRFQLLERIELHQFKERPMNDGGIRSPLAVRLFDKESGLNLVAMVNHLARGNADLRRQQAEGLREWVKSQTCGVICVGDFNMDFDFATRQGNDAFNEMLRGNAWQWVAPQTMIDSNWWDPEGDGVDNFDGSLLDLAFVANEAKSWQPACEVLVRWNDFPDNAETSDHRPILLEVTLPSSRVGSSNAE